MWMKYVPASLIPCYRPIAEHTKFRQKTPISLVLIMESTERGRVLAGMYCEQSYLGGS